ncbi:MAG: pitrilysin family protein [Thermodesulfobacteriota bacterium]|nr:pitrilysin family protein [Thermodesulfobacteriota bacterium]
MKDYKRYTLENGITVILRENHSAPVAAINVWVNVGSGDETNENAGISHVVEHMLFKGTKKRVPGEMAYEVESSGGEINAFTSFDQTVYHIVIASRFFDLALDALSDAVMYPSLSSSELEKEKEVIMEEIKRGEDHPMVRLSQTLFSTSYESHSYRRPIIGFKDTVKGFTQDDLFDFYRRWYVPSNITVVAVGDFDNDLTIEKIEKAFEGFSSQYNACRNRERELSQNGIRRAVLIDSVTESYASMAFHIPGISHKDSCAIDILSFILGHGESSRLFNNVKDKKGLVHTIHSYNFMPEEPGLLVINSTMDKEKSEEAFASILEETYRLRYEDIHEEELERAKLNIESEFVYDKETMQGQARQLGQFEVIAKDIDFEKDYIRRILKVKTKDIKRVARKYLNTKNLTAVFLMSQADGDIIDKDTIKEIASKEESKIRRNKTKPPVKRLDHIERIVIENGITLLIKEDHSTPLVAMRSVCMGGLRFEEKKFNGINNFVAEMLTKGTKSLSAFEIAQKIDSIAAYINGCSGRNSFGIACETLSKFFDSGLRLFADIFLNPTFDVNELEKKKTDILSSIKQQEDNMTAYTFKIFSKTLFNTHPYGMSLLGTTESIPNINQDILKEYYESYAVPKNTVLSIVGDINTDDAIEKTRQLFEGRADRDFTLPSIAKENPPDSIKNIEVERDKKQAHLILGFLGTTIYSPDRYPLEILNTVLSGQGGRLFVKLRDTLSLAYAVTSFSIDGIDPGSFGVYIGTSPEKVDMAFENIKKELKGVTDEKITEEEFKRAKRYLIGNFDISLQTNSTKATNMALCERYGLGYSHFLEYPKRISQVTRDDVLEAARKYIDLDRYSIVIVRPHKD